MPQLGDAALRELGRLRGLRALVLQRAACTDDGLRALGALRQLESLDLGGCEHITAQALLQLPVTLQHLTLRECPQVGAAAGSILRDRFPGLRRLDLAQNDWVDDDVLAAVLQLPRLEHLSIALCTSTTAASLPRVAAAPASLRVLTATRVPWLTRPALDELQVQRPDLQVTTFVW